MPKRSRSTPKQTRALEMRQRLLDTAVHLLSQEEPLTTRGIAEAANVSIGTVYRYFGDREEILGVLTETMTRQVYDDLTTAVASALDRELDEATLLIVESLTASFERNAPILRAISERGTDPVLAQQVEATLFALARLLPARHRPDLSPAEIDDLVFVAMGFVANGCLRIALLRPAGGDRDAMVALTARMLSSALR